MIKNYTFFIPGLILILFLFGHNVFLDFLGTILLIGILLFYFKTNLFFLTYFALMFFEQIIIIPNLEGSFLRIYQVLFLVRIIYDLVSFKIKFNPLRFNHFSSIFFFLGLLLFLNLNEIISIFINIFIITYILFFYNNKEVKILNLILMFFSIFILSSGIYGIFFIPPINYGSYLRFSSIIGDPNYSALFYIIGLISSLFYTNYNRIHRFLLFLLYTILIIITFSFTGYFFYIITVLSYLFFIKRRMFYSIMFLLILNSTIFLSLDFPMSTFFYLLQERILGLFTLTNLDVISSGRLSIQLNYLNYFLNLPLMNQLFGGLNTVSGNFRDLMVLNFESVSHSSIIDLLFMEGIIGSIIFLFIYVLSFIRYFNKFLKSRNPIYLGLSILKLFVLGFSFTISIFPFRYFYLIFIL